MFFLTDANIFLSMIQGLRALGHDVFDLKEESLEKLTDTEVYTLAREKNRILITMDKDFSSIILYPPGEHPGIIIVRLYRLKIDQATSLFLDAIKRLKAEDMHGHLVIIDPVKIRVRKEKW